MKIFAATNSLPKPDMAGGDRRFFEILKMFSRQHKVTLLIQNFPTDLKADEPYITRLREIGVRDIVLGCQRMTRTMLKQSFNLGFFEFYHVAEALADDFRKSQPGAPIIVDSVDISFLREAGAVKLGKLTIEEAFANKQRELKVYKEATAVINVTHEDDEALKQELPGIKTWLIPIIVPLFKRQEILREPIVLFIGGFKHLPNVDGILWFVSEVWPDIREQVADAQLKIVGNHPTTEITSLNRVNGIEVTGFVPDTAPYLDQAAISIAPLRYGAGMKGKVSEALAAGIPVVTTSLGVQGFSAISGEHLLATDEPKQFANYVIELLNNPTKTSIMGIQGQNLVKGLCSIEAVAKKVDEMLEEAGLLQDRKNFYKKRMSFFMHYLRESSSRLIPNSAITTNTINFLKTIMPSTFKRRGRQFLNALARRTDLKQQTTNYKKKFNSWKLK